jgi:methionyl-tRNA formyltransferase
VNILLAGEESAGIQTLKALLESMSGEKEIGVVKARLTGERCDSSPGTVGEVVGSGVKVACGDEWIVVNKLEVEGRYVDSAEVLKPGKSP